jgi:Ser/Thr protein kinase RdoA (MazF antagonist)
LLQEDHGESPPGIVKTALHSYPLPDNLTVRLINHTENETYKLEDPVSGCCWALRIHRPGYHSSCAIGSEIAWLMALRKDRVVATPIPVEGRNGELIQIIQHPSLTESRHVVLYEWEQGEQPHLTPDSSQNLRESFAMLGAVTAKMHSHSKFWKRPQGFERFTWDFETTLGATPHWGRWRDGMGVDAETCELFGKTAKLISHRLDRYGKGPGRFGLIHADLRLSNLLIHQGEVKVLDFDDSGFGWFMYDAATAVSFQEHLPEVSGLIEHWCQGYRTVSELCQRDEEEIPTFVILRRLLLVAWCGSHCQTDLAKSMGMEYTQQAVDLCETYLTRFS